MGKPAVKFVTDFGPLLIFFVIYFKNGQDLKIAIPPFVLATIVSLLIVFFFRKKNSNGTFNKWHTYYIIRRPDFIF